MPTVPISTVPDVSPAGLPTPQLQSPARLLNFADIGPGETVRAGQALQNAGATGAGIATDLQQQATDTEAKDLDAQMADAVTSTLYGSPDGKSPGFTQLRGQPAVDAKGDTLDALQKTASDLLGNASNPVVKTRLQSMFQARLQAATNTIESHANGQQHVALVDATAARVSALSDSMSKSFDPTPGADNSLFALNRKTLIGEVTASAADPLTLGLSGDALQQHVRAVLSTADAAVVQHLLSTDQTSAAAAYLSHVRADLPADVGDRLAGQIQVGSAKDAGLDAALQLQSDHPNDFAAQEAALKDLRRAGKIEATAYDVALQHLSADEARQNQADRQTEQAFLGRYFNQIQASRGTFKLTSMPAADFAYATAHNLGPTLTQYIQQSRPDTPAVDDAKLYVNMLQMAANDPAAFLKTDLGALAGSLTKPHFDHLASLSGSINKADVKAMTLQRQMHDTVESITGDIAAAGIDLKAKPDTPAAQTLAQFQSSLHDALQAAQTTKGGTPLTPEEMRSIGLGLVRDQALAGTGMFGLFKSTAKPYAMTDEQKARPWEIPAADRAQITRALAKAGQPVNEDNVQRIYKRSRGVY